MRMYAVFFPQMPLKQVAVVFLICISEFMKEENGTVRLVGLIPTKSVYIANALAGPCSAMK